MANRDRGSTSERNSGQGPVLTADAGIDGEVAHIPRAEVGAFQTPGNDVEHRISGLMLRAGDREVGNEFEVIAIDRELLAQMRSQRGERLERAADAEPEHLRNGPRKSAGAFDLQPHRRMFARDSGGCGGDLRLSLSLELAEEHQGEVKRLGANPPGVHRVALAEDRLGDPGANFLIEVQSNEQAHGGQLH